MDAKRPTPRHIIIKMAKVKDKENLKSQKRKIVTYKGAPIRISYHLTSQQKHFRTEGTDMKYSK